MPVIFKDILNEDNVALPYQIVLERRKSIRVSIAAKSAYLRLPLFTTKKQVEQQHQKFLAWAKKELRENPKIRQRFTVQSFEAYRHLSVMNKVFSIRTTLEADSENIKIKLDSDLQEVNVKISKQSDYQDIPRLLSRGFSKVFLSEVESEVYDLNARHFGFDYAKIRLKYNATNWGSCSKKKNINLSSRLLLVPDEVRHYVIVHELAHLQELNHSKKFWSLVEGALPNYRHYENWLKEKGSVVDF